MGYACDAVGLVPLGVSKLPLPSRSQSYLTIVPSGSLEPPASSVTRSPTKAGLGATASVGSGSALLTVTLTVVVAVAPSESVTRSPTAYVPAAG